MRHPHLDQHKLPVDQQPHEPREVEQCEHNADQKVHELHLGFEHHQVLLHVLQGQDEVRGVLEDVGAVRVEHRQVLVDAGDEVDGQRGVEEDGLVGQREETQDEEQVGAVLVAQDGREIGQVELDGAVAAVHGEDADHSGYEWRVGLVEQRTEQEGDFEQGLHFVEFGEGGVRVVVHDLLFNIKF